MDRCDDFPCLAIFAECVKIFGAYGAAVLQSAQKFSEKRRYRIAFSELKSAFNRLEEIAQAIWDPTGVEDQLEMAVESFTEDYDARAVNPNTTTLLDPDVDYTCRFEKVEGIVTNFINHYYHVVGASEEALYVENFLRLLREQLG